MVYFWCVSLITVGIRVHSWYESLITLYCINFQQFAVGMSLWFCRLFSHGHSVSVWQLLLVGGSSLFSADSSVWLLYFVHWWCISLITVGCLLLMRQLNCCKFFSDGASVWLLPVFQCWCISLITVGCSVLMHQFDYCQFFSVDALVWLLWVIAQCWCISVWL